MSYIEVIKLLLKEKNMTEYALAKKSGISQPNINRWLNYKNEPTISNLEKVCAALDLRLVDLLALADDLEIQKPEKSSSYQVAITKKGTHMSEQEADVIRQEALKQIRVLLDQIENSDIPDTQN